MITYAVSIHFYQNVNEIIALAVISIAEVNWESHGNQFSKKGCLKFQIYVNIKTWVGKN